MDRLREADARAKEERQLQDAIEDIRNLKDRMRRRAKDNPFAHLGSGGEIDLSRQQLLYDAHEIDGVKNERESVIMRDQ